MAGGDVQAAREALRPLMGYIICLPAEGQDHLVAQFGLNHRVLPKNALTAC